jgi:FG-GAP-like repeat
MKGIAFLRALVLLVATVAAAASLTAQTPSTVSITATPSTLILPGTLTLTTTVNQVPVAGGVPTGMANFFYDGTNSLGSAPLKVLSSTQAFPASASAIVATPDSSPVGIVAFTRAAGASPALVSVDQSSGEVTLYNFASKVSTPSLYSYTVSSPQPDAIGSGFFLLPKSQGVQSFLVHGGSTPTTPDVGTYSVFDGTFATVRPVLNPPTKVSPSGCNCGRADNEQIAIDDFDGDGYSDVAVLLGTQVVGNTVEGALPGVMLNAGSSNAGSFATSTFIQAALPATFCATSFTTGHFTSAAGAQLVVAGTTPMTGENCLDFASTDPSTIYLFALDATKTQLTLVSTISTAPGASSLAAADLNLDGKTDLIIGNNSQKGIMIAFGNGDGTFATESSLIATSGIPLSSDMIVSDLNGDGYPDIALIVADLTNEADDVSILLNDGTGNFKDVTQITGLNLYTDVPVSTDLNGDGLPDLALLSQAGTTPAINLSILINYAAAQATLTTTASPLPAGTHTLVVIYPGDNNFIKGASAALTEQVNQTVPTLSWPTPASITYGTALSTMATASVPGTFAYNPALNTILPLGTDTLTATFTPTDIFDYSGASVTQSITVTLPPVAVTLSGPSTTAPGEPTTVNLTVNPFPHAVTATVTLSFVPAPPNTVGDAMVVFSNNTTTYSTPPIPANTPAASIPLTFQSGSTAGTITVTTHLIDDVTGADVTPASLAPTVITVPAGPPVITSGTLTRSGSSLQVALLGLSSTRDMTQAEFHFTAVAGKSLATTDLTVPVTSAFQTWYQSSASDADGTTFTYTQPFTITGDASDVQSISVTLTNSQGTSESTTMQ